MNDTKKRTREEITAAIEDYLTENGDLWADIAEELDSENGFLGDDKIFYMDEMNELFPESSDALWRAFYGYDYDESYTDAEGRTHREPFNPFKKFFGFNGYGNFISYAEKDYSDKIDDYAVEQIIEYRARLWSVKDNEELSALLDEYEDAAE